MVADSLIPPAGRTVKCGKCANQWFVSAPPAAANASFAEQVQEAVSAPDTASASEIESGTAVALAPYHIPMLPIKLAVPLLAVAWILIGAHAYFPRWQHAPVLSGIYHMLGADDTRGLVFSDVAMERVDKEGRTSFILTGGIANHAAAERKIAKVRVQMKDDHSKVMWERAYPVNITVKPGDVYPFRIEDVDTAFADRVVSLVLDVGNGFELGAR